MVLLRDKPPNMPNDERPFCYPKLLPDLFPLLRVITELFCVNGIVQDMDLPAAYSPFAKKEGPSGLRTCEAVAAHKPYRHA